MKRFQSRIESLHRVREQTEKLARLKAAEAQSEKVRIDQKVAEINERITANEELGYAELSGGQIELVRSVMNTTARLKAERSEVVKEQYIVCQNLITATQAVAAAQSQLNIVETYIEKERTTHRRQQLLEEENTRQENTARRFSQRESDTRRSGTIENNEPIQTDAGLTKRDSRQAEVTS